MVANESLADTVNLTVDLPGKKKLSVVRPEAPDAVSFESQLTLAPQSAAVLMEID